ncbi:MAG: T9SS type A sorting domain-containing protein [Owenweeksia sp.]|nr:T9SS type A sorting domain-containing protein [Owenweeksia sp.]
MASRPNPADSLYYDFYHLQGTPAGGLVTFDTGYSATETLPNSQTNSQNAAVSIDHETGLIEYDINSGSSGIFATGVKVECWRDDQLASVIKRDFPAFHDNSVPVNNPPNAVIDTAIYDLENTGAGYRVFVTPGDSVRFKAGSTDFDFNGGSTPQNVTFKANGSALGSNWGGIYNFQDQPVISPVAPQSSFVSAQNNQVSFDWLVTYEHLQGAETRYYFNLQFHDDACPTNGRANLPLQVVVSAPAAIPMDSLSICENDSLQLPGKSFSGSYQWSPAIEISSTTAANPWVYPTASRYYYLEDPNNPGYKDSIYVDLEMRKTFKLDSVNSMLQVTDSVQSGNRLWYYSGIPFSYPFDTLTPFGPGDYWVVLNTENCRYESDTVTFIPASYSIADPNQGNLAPNPLSMSDSWGVQFELTNIAAGNLSTIYLPGIDTSGETTADDLQFQLYDSSGNLLWSKDTVVTGFSRGVFQVSLRQNLQANVQYTLAVTGDTGYAFHYFEDLPNLPVSPWNNGLSITGLFEGAANALPAQPHDKVLPLVLEVESTIGLETYADSRIRVYPNPAQDMVYIEGAEKGSDLKLLDMQGKKIREFEVTSGRQALERGGLPKGIYFILLPSGATEKIVFK